MTGPGQTEQDQLMTLQDFRFHQLRRVVAAVLVIMAAFGLGNGAFAQTEIDITGGRATY